MPELLARRIGDGSEPPHGWSIEACELAVVGLDISESTSIMEDLVRWSPDGSETIANALNTVFSMVGDVITEYHGSVVTLAGDEVLAVWSSAEFGGATAAVNWAARAARAIEEKAGRLAPVGGYPIRLRAGIGEGPAWLLDIGAERGRRIFVPVGPCFHEMAHAQKAVEASDIGASDHVRLLLGATAKTEPANGAPAVGRLSTVQPAFDPPPRPVRPRVSLPAALAARYVPDVVLERWDGSRGTFQPELAPVTAMFISFRPRPWDEEAARVVSEASLHALDILTRYEGSIINAAQDLGGLTLVAGFGLPPRIREREALRANLAALEISRAMQGFVDHGIGVATGQAFCGVCGSATYRQFMMVGPVVNLAARLMQRAQNEALCDQVSQHLSRDRVHFSARGRTDMKGFAGPIEVYRPEWHEADPGLPTLRRLAGDSKVLVTRGRDREREELGGRLVALSLGTSTTVIVEGDPGVGKTHLAGDLLQASEGYGRITVFVGSGDDVDPRPYHAWKRVFSKALGLSSVRDPNKRARVVKERLSKWPELAEWAALLNEVLDLSLDDASLRDMTGRARRENTVRVLVQLLSEAAGETPLLIVLDDCQWLDSASWELVRAVHRNVEPVMLVLLTRSLPEESPAPGVDGSGSTRSAGIEDGAAHTAAEVTSYLRERGALVLSLRPLAPDTTEQIARDFLGVEALDEPVRSLFRGKVEGSPLFTVELAFQLQTDEVIAVVGTADTARGRLAVPPTELDRLRLPVRVEEVFRARLGALSDRQRMVIRAASVVGTSFDDKHVLAADPLLDPRFLAEDLEDLKRKKVIALKPDGWRFAHALIRDVARQSFLPSELRQGHRALAEWYEKHDREPENYAIIARHWAEAGDVAQEVEYLEAAATSALARGAEEATSLLELALALDVEQAGRLTAVSDARRAFWHSELGQALADHNRLDEAISHFRTALGLLGHRVPTSRLGWLAKLVGKALVQVVHLIVAPRASRDRDAAVLRQAVGILSQLGLAYYFKAEVVPWTATSLAAINLAERAGDEGIAGEAYSGLANLVGTLRLHRLAARYFERARRKIVGEPTGTASPLTREVLPDAAWQHGATAALSEAIYLRTMNRTTNVTAMLDDVIQGSRAFGQNQVLEIQLAVRGFFHEMDGRLRSARADYEELLISARRRGNAEHVVWGIALLVPLLISLDHPHEASALDDEAFRESSESFGLFGPMLHASHVMALQVRGLDEDALAHGRRVLSASGMTPYIYLTSLTAMVQVCVELLEKRQVTALGRDVRDVSRRALAALRRYVRLYPFARARYQLYLGRYQAALGRDKAARRRWTRALSDAQQAGLLLDGARIRLLLAAQLPEGSAARDEHLRQARQTVDELGLRRLKEFERLAAS
ncbi:MAG TPA: AAA family ATPase [Blastococcus sp.]|nr:AAA family ATPase [Blastococcus sp.]